MNKYLYLLIDKWADWFNYVTSVYWCTNHCPKCWDIEVYKTNMAPVYVELLDYREESDPEKGSEFPRFTQPWESILGMEHS